ncbi:MAG: ribonuclease HII [Deltaproteobacteria bacterium]|nr:ribonuclease HII [Deltaproteobacteria bacterium]
MSYRLSFSIPRLGISRLQPGEKGASLDTFEKIAYQEGYQLIAGVDEAGRGPLAGPVVAAAVIFPPDYVNPEINDSKKLSAAKREKLYEVIRKEAVAIGTGVVDADIIDQFNILRATLQAMREAVLELSTSPDFLLIDGLHCIPLHTPQKPLVKGDSLSISIAAASIIAKVSRDRIMEIYHRQFPQYNFQKNKGYGTKEHCSAIEQFGMCKIHRKSFHVKNLNQTTLEFTF